MILDLERLDGGGLVLLLDEFDDSADDLVGDVGDVRSSFRRRDRVAVRDLLELSFGDGESDLPSFAESFVDDGGFRDGSSHVGSNVSSLSDLYSRDGAVDVVYRSGVHLDVRLEVLDLDSFVVEENFDAFGDSGHVVDSFLDERDGVLIDRGHIESREIRDKGDASPVLLLLVVGDFRLVLRSHVVSERLLVAFTGDRVARLDGEFGRVDVGELGSVSVSTSGDLSFVIVVIRGGEEVTEDELGDVAAFSGVHLDRDSLSVVVDGDGGIFDVDIDFERIHRGVSDLHSIGSDSSYHSSGTRNEPCCRKR